MSSKLNMQDIVDFLVAKNDISKEEAEKFIVELFSLIEKGLTDDELSKVKDFGTFKLTHIKERESIDVNTKERIVIPAHRRVSFVPAQLLKELVNKPFSHFETTPLNDGVFIDGIPHDETSKRERLEETDDGDDNNSKESEPTKEEIIVKSNLIVTAVEDAKKEKDEFLVPITSSALDTESNKEEDANEEGPIGEEKKEVDKDKVVVGLSETPSVDKSRPKRKPRRYLLRSATIVLFIIFAIGFAYNYYFSENSLEQEVKISEAAKSVDKSTVSSTEDPLGEPDIVIDSVDTVEPRTRETAKMSPGRTLRLIALDRFGDREFWVYIYMTNKDKITNPNIVPIGLVLELPHHDEYPLDATNPEDIAKAKKLGDEVMKSFAD